MLKIPGHSFRLWYGITGVRPITLWQGAGEMTHHNFKSRVSALFIASIAWVLFVTALMSAVN